jgi:hypothetical protein
MEGVTFERSPKRVQRNCRGETMESHNGKEGNCHSSHTQLTPKAHVVLGLGRGDATPSEFSAICRKWWV